MYFLGNSRIPNTQNLKCSLYLSSGYGDYTEKKIIALSLVKNRRKEIKRMLEADCKIKCWIMSHALWCVFTADSISITLNDWIRQKREFHSLRMLTKSFNVACSGKTTTLLFVKYFPKQTSITRNIILRISYSFSTPV